MHLIGILTTVKENVYILQLYAVVAIVYTLIIFKRVLEILVLQVLILLLSAIFIVIIKQNSRKLKTGKKWINLLNVSSNSLNSDESYHVRYDHFGSLANINGDNTVIVAEVHGGGENKNDGKTMNGDMKLSQKF